jgi:hypothetical protein
LTKNILPNTFADRVINFNQNLSFGGNLPDGFQVINPFLDNPETIVVMKKFYEKFYNDSSTRKFLIGINPSRHGAGVTGVPFTDTKRLDKICGIQMETAYTHEISSVFMYDMIEEYGGVNEFYKDFYINSPFPLAITRLIKGNWLNANYYDDAQLFENVKAFMIETLKRHISLGLDTSEVYVLGKKNAVFISKINQQEKLFDKIVVLEHPRYIQQYRSKDKPLFIDKYILALKQTSDF